MPELHDPKDMMQRYRNVFGSTEGKIVLGDILTTGHFGETINPTDYVAMTENIFSTQIARMAGAFDSLWIDLGMNQKEK